MEAWNFGSTSTSLVEGEPRTIDEANRIIVRIQGRKGHLSDDTVKWLKANGSSEQCREIIDGFEAFRRDAVKLVQSTTTLNSSDAHFIHELLQNADDSQYSKARGRNESAWIRFKLSDSAIVVETNEDGFTRADVEAICETGESSKKVDVLREHIGEKGIGFKSIFRVAEEVHINSGLWNFHFKHKDGQDGLGMVTPLLSSPVALPEGVGTRITLRLNTRYRKNSARIFKEFEELPDTVIFFLRNITTLEYYVKTSASSEVVTVINKAGLSTSNGTELVKTTYTTVEGVQNPIPLKTRTFYETYSSPPIVMPEDRRRRVNHASVILAFPIDADGAHAVIDRRGQHVFAFLPLYRKVQLAFLIQSDFITAANRESTEDCDWNDYLLQATADTFCDAVESFCRRGFLVYEWPKFVPQLAIDGYWRPLQSLIINGLRQKKVFRTLTSGRLRLPKRLREVPFDFMHESAPLVPDRTGSQEVYLATEYYSYTDLLEQVGIVQLSDIEALDRLEDDLASTTSRFQSVSTSRGWQDTMASWLLAILGGPGSQHNQRRMKSLNIVPLSSGKWRAVFPYSGASQHLYFPLINDVKVPRDIGYDLIDTEALQSPRRMLLFRKLGIGYCDVSNVQLAIMKLHESAAGPTKSSIEGLVDHLYFFYRLKISMTSKRQKFWVCSSTRELKLSTSELYLESDKKFGASWLINEGKKISAESKLADESWLLHPFYFHDRLIDRPESKVSWRSWLQQEFDFREFPALTVTNAQSQVLMSPFMECVLSTSSRLFLSTLQAHWNVEYESIYAKSVFLKENLRKCMVNCDNTRRQLLGNTYLPCSKVIDQATNLGVWRHCNILSLDLHGRPFMVNEWTCLPVIGAHPSVDVEFYLQALKQMQQQNITGKAILAYDCLGASASKEQAQHLKANFKSSKIVHTGMGFSGNQWACSEDCVWNGPTCLTIKRPIASIYGANANVMHLFKTLLELPDATWLHLVEQLKFFKATAKSKFSVAQAAEVYSEIHKMKDVDWKVVRSTFTENELIFANGQWYNLSVCLWSSSINIEGQPILGKLYPNLDVFFTKNLGVKKATVGQLLSELTRKAKAKDGLKIEEAKEFIKKISRMLTADAPDPTFSKRLEELLKYKFLPVQEASGVKRLADYNDNFAIRDHDEYSKIFTGMGSFLDFSYEEVPQIGRFLEALPQNLSYLSKDVKARICVGDDAIFNNAVTQELRAKAPWLFSCAYKYESKQVVEQDDSLLHVLQNLEVHTSAKISTELILKLGEVELKSPSTEAQVLVENRGEKLILFVPSNPKMRKSSLRVKLPSELLLHLDIDNENASAILREILISDITEMADVMKAGNIPCVPWLDPQLYSVENIQDTTQAVNRSFSSQSVAQDVQMTRDLTTMPSDRTPDIVRSHDQDGPLRDSVFTPATRNSSISSASTLVGGATQSFNANRPSTLTNNSANSEPSVFGRQTAAHSTPTRTQISQRDFRSSLTLATQSETRSRNDINLPSNINLNFAFTPRPPPLVQQQMNYKHLLDQVIKCANRQGRVSSSHNDSRHNVFDFSTLEATLPVVFDTESTFGPPGFVRNSKIGAAGELFVFERLKCLNLPNFSTDNWQSVMRKYVTVHPTYGEMQNWSGRETADIVYKDDPTGRMQDWLKRVSCNGFPDLPSSPSSNSERKYYIEVKTTIWTDCDTTFYMSNNEYELMHDLRTDPQKEPDAIYVIVRVFNLTTPNINFRVFVDPCRSRVVGAPTTRPALVFEAAQWDVTPFTS